MKTPKNDFAEKIRSLLGEELAPKRAEALAKKIAAFAPAPPPARPAPKPVVRDFTAVEALAFIAGQLGQAAASSVPARKAPRVKKGGWSSPEAREAARARMKTYWADRRAAKATEAEPAAKAAKPAAKKSAAKKVAAKKATPAKKAMPPAKGKRKLTASAHNMMAEKKELYWAIYRKAKGDPAQPDDAGRIANGDPELIASYQKGIKVRLSGAAPANAKPTAKKSAAKKAPAPAVKSKPAAKRSKATKSAPAEAAEAATEATSPAGDGVAVEPPPAPALIAQPAAPEPATPNGAGLSGYSEEQRKALGL